MDQCIDPQQHGELQWRGWKKELERVPGAKSTYLS